MDKQKALEIFQLESLEGVTSKNLKAMYRILAKKKHPDQGGDTVEFVELKKAYHFLSEELQDNTSKTSMKTKKYSVEEMQNLDKQEILDKYFQDTEKLQLKVSTYEQSLHSQVNTLAVVQSEAKSIVEEFEKHKLRLEKELEDKITELENQYAPSFWSRILFFLPSHNQDRFWQQYHLCVNLYYERKNQLDEKFFEELARLYARGLTNLSKNVTSIQFSEF